MSEAEWATARLTHPSFFRQYKHWLKKKADPLWQYANQQVQQAEMDMLHAQAVANEQQAKRQLEIARLEEHLNKALAK